MEDPRFFWRILRGFGAGLFVLVALLAMLGTWLAYDGHRAWERTRRDLRARGEKLSLSELLPLPVPDESNFFADPLWREKGDIIEAALARVGELAVRPHARIIPPGSTDTVPLLEAMDRLRACANLLQARARAALASGDTQAAGRDVLMLLRLADALAEQPLLVSFLYRMAQEYQTQKVINEGLIRHAWTPDQLATFKRALAARDLPAALSATLRSERGYCNQAAEEWKKTSADPKFYMTIFGEGNAAYYNQMIQEWVEALDAVPRKGLTRKTISMEKIEAVKANPFTRFRYAVARIGIPNIVAIGRETARQQDGAQQTRIVCALEEYRLRHGSYPDSLDALVPEFLPEVPRDVVTLRPMRYLRLAPDKFQLWSPGWDGPDKETPAREDWVWGEEP